MSVLINVPDLINKQPKKQKANLEFQAVFAAFITKVDNRKYRSNQRTKLCLDLTGKDINAGIHRILELNSTDISLITPLPHYRSLSTWQRSHSTDTFVPPFFYTLTSVSSTVLCQLSFRRAWTDNVFCGLILRI